MRNISRSQSRIKRKKKELTDERRRKIVSLNAGTYSGPARQFNSKNVSCIGILLYIVVARVKYMGIYL